MSAEPIPYFLQRLDLGLEAEARDIKRAYARELKLIDQEADLEGFQSLRECYDIGLRWAAYEADRKEQEALSLLPAPAAATETVSDGLDALDVVLPAATRVNLLKAQPASAAATQAPAGLSTEAASDPDRLSLAVYQRFSSAYALLSQGRIVDDESLWETELRRCLDDEELINLEARTIFEARIAHLLAGDWQQANAPLLGAASRVFEWSGDRKRLQQFGYAGAFLYQAIEEHRMFESQGEQELNAQRALLARLRSPGAANNAGARPERVQLERLIARFPSYLALCASREAVEKWRLVQKKARPAPVRELAADDTPEPVLYGDTSGQRGFDKAWILFLVIAVAALLRIWQVHGGSFAPTAYAGGQFYPPDAPVAANETPAPPAGPGSRRVDKGNRPVAAQRPLERKVLEAIEQDIDYKYSQDATPGERVVKFEVFLDADGKVLGMNKLIKSIDIDYDNAVAAAIKRAKPFPPDAGTRLTLQFGITLIRKAPRPAKAAPARQTSPVDEPKEEPSDETPVAED